MRKVERGKSRRKRGSRMNYDYCIHDRFEQCFHDCEKCPKAETSEPDPDELFEIEREEML